MNTYSKYEPNVFLAKCTEKHEKVNLLTSQPGTVKKMKVRFII